GRHSDAVTSPGLETAQESAARALSPPAKVDTSNAPRLVANAPVRRQGDLLTRNSDATSSESAINAATAHTRVDGERATPPVDVSPNSVDAPLRPGPLEDTARPDVDERPRSPEPTTDATNARQHGSSSPLAEVASADAKGKLDRGPVEGRLSS